MLPLKDVQAKQATQENLFQPHQFAPDNVILLVEDNPWNQQVMQSFFEELALPLHVADNGRAGIEKIKALQEEGCLPDLILMDLHMPEMDGFETTRTIRKDPDIADIPIVILSADAFIEQQKTALELGIKDYLTKPIDFVQLSSILTHYLRQVKPIPLKALPPLPDSTRAQVLARLENLVHIPVVLLDEILENTQKIRELCQGFDSIYPDLLQQIDHAAYNGDEAQIATLVKKGLSC